MTRAKKAQTLRVWAFFFLFICSSAFGSEELTIICTTNPIPSIPKTDILYASMRSLHKVPRFRECKKIIVFDGIQPGFEKQKKDYDTYKQNVEKLVRTSPYFHNTELVYCEKWSHLAGAIQAAIEKVETPFVFIHQHDFLLKKKIDVPGLLAAMKTHPEIKHVRLNAYRRNKPSKTWGTHYAYDGDVERAFKKGPVVLCRTFGWSDNDHFARTDYYRDFVLPRCEFGAMEWFLHTSLKSDLKERGMEAQIPYGTFLYGDLQDGRYIVHLDGRQAYNH